MTEHLKHINVTEGNARRLTYVAPKKAILEPVKVGRPGKREVMLRARFSAISKGTESLVFSGQVPHSEWQRMQCPHMAGSFAFPVSYGYACVAEVVETGAGVDSLETGDPVFVLHPHQELFCVNETSCQKLPENLPLTRAVLAANMETGLNAVWDSNILDSPELKCAVIGAGTVGLLTAFALQHEAGASPTIVDVNPARKPIANQLGLEFATPAELATGNHREFDLVFHTSASESGLQLAIDHAAFEGSVIEMSWYGSRTTALSLGGAFHSRRLSIRSSQVGHVASRFRDSISHSARLQKAITMLQADALDNLLEKSIDFLNLPDHLELIFESDGLCQLVAY